MATWSGSVRRPAQQLPRPVQRRLGGLRAARAAAACRHGGEDRVLVGSDYPYPLGERPAGAVVRAADFLTDDQRVKLLSANALRFLHG
ncbi:amidohydrolase family protein [Micromonospora sp. M12]